MCAQVAESFRLRELRNSWRTDQANVIFVDLDHFLWAIESKGRSSSFRPVRVDRVSSRDDDFACSFIECHTAEAAAVIVDRAGWLPLAFA